MNNFTKVLLTVPFLFGTVACAGEDRIVTGPHPYGGGLTLTVNCSQNLIKEPFGGWVTRNKYPGMEEAHDKMVKQICRR